MHVVPGVKFWLMKSTLSGEILNSQVAADLESVCDPSVLFLFAPA